MNEYTSNLTEYIRQFDIVALPFIVGDEIKMNALYYDDKESYICFIEATYNFIMSNFEMEYDEYELVNLHMYIERLHTFVTNIREKNENEIIAILEYLNNENKYIVKCIIMLWCIPDNYFDNGVDYDNFKMEYKNNITQYNYKIVNLINRDVIKKFCEDILLVHSFFTIHCFEYIWFYMNEISIEFKFVDCPKATVGFCVDIEKFKQNCQQTNIDNKTNEFIQIQIDIIQLFELGIGNHVYTNRKTLSDFLSQYLFTDDQTIEKYSDIYGEKYIKAANYIKKN
jgi:hypothetical protein